MKTETKKTFLVLGFFALAMGMLESSVVIYLRELYYPNGFQFPLVRIDPHISIVELSRELATVIMLAGAGYLAGKTSLSRFAYFCYAFAIWDIFYYVFLYVFLGWPSSLATWDLLFLIPAPWIGPVWAPVLISLTMIVAALIYVKNHEQGKQLKTGRKFWFLLLSGGMICVVSFMWDFIKIIGSSINPLTALSEDNESNPLYHFIPQEFHYLLFGLGYVFILAALYFPFINLKKQVS